MKKYIQPILLAIVYLVMQGIAGVAMVIAYLIMHPELFNDFINGKAEAVMSGYPMEWLALSVIVSGVLTVLIGTVMKLINWKTAFSCSGSQMRSAWLPLVAALCGIVAITVFVEQVQLENVLEQQFAEMMQNGLGIISICLAAPIVEELCFREGILGGLVRRGVKPWVAIGISALIFGVIHGNPVQIAGAGLMGIILGIIYYKSGNIVLTTILHIFNNSLATILALVFGMDATLSDIVGSTTATVAIAIVCAIVCAVLFVRYWKSAR